MRVINIFSLALGVLLAMFTQQGYSQNALNVAGNSATVNGIRFDYSIGEMVLVNTARNPNLVVTQGILQPHGTGQGSTQENPSVNPSNMNDLVKVYPNPTKDVLFVEINTSIDGNIDYEVYDATGKIISSKSGNYKSGVHKLSIDMQSLAAGSYYLMLRSIGAEGKATHYSYKVQKTN